MSILRATYRVPLARLEERAFCAHTTRLACARRGWTSTRGSKKRTSAPLNCYFYRIGHDYLEVPRFYGLIHFGSPDVDDRTAGLPAQIPPLAFPLRGQQTQAVAAAERELQQVGGTLLMLPCGFGKTVCALAIATHLKRRALILVHRKPLLEQWKDRIEQFLPGVSIGVIQGRRRPQTSDAVVLCMLQTFCKQRDAIPETLRRSFGFVVVDECHHIGAELFSLALPILPARYILGLSATPRRKDGLTNVIPWTIGLPAFTAEPDWQHLDVRVLKIAALPRCALSRTKAALITALLQDLYRTGIIAERVAEMATLEDRQVLVLSDRLAHLDDLEGALPPNLHVARYRAKMNAEERRAVGDAQVILGTFTIASEGIDIPSMDSIVLAAPHPDVQQAVGRLRPKYETNRRQTVLDISDLGIPECENYAFGRLRQYNKFHVHEIVVERVLRPNVDVPFF